MKTYRKPICTLAAVLAGLSALAGGGSVEMVDCTASSLSLAWSGAADGRMYKVSLFHERNVGGGAGEPVWRESFRGAPSRSGESEDAESYLESIADHSGWQGMHLCFSTQEGSLRLDAEMGDSWLLSPEIDITGVDSPAVSIMLRALVTPRSGDAQAVPVMAVAGGRTNVIGTAVAGRQFSRSWLPIGDGAPRRFRLLLTPAENGFPCDIDVMGVGVYKDYRAGSTERVLDMAVNTTNRVCKLEGLVPREYICRVDALSGNGETEKCVGECKADLINPPSREKSMTVKMLFLVLQIGIIVFAAKLGGMLASVLRMPGVIGELGAGVLIGPYALGKIGFTVWGFDIFEHGIFPLSAGTADFPVSVELYGICTIASVVLLFLSGVETNFKMFLRYSFAGLIIGVGGVVVSFLLGNWCASMPLPWLGDTLLHHFIPIPMFDNLSMFSPPALFMGILGTATSVGITARILSERKKMDSREGVTIMASAVIDDVIGIVVLAIGLGVIKSASGAGAGASGAHSLPWGDVGMVAAKAFGVWLIGTVLGLALARKISFVLKLFKSPVAVATLAFAMALIIASIFQAMDLSLIIGAYVMGLALSRTDIRHLIQENLQSIYTFFVPIFFCVMGMLVDLSQLASRDVLVFGAIYTALSILAKILGCALPAYFCGFNAVGALRIGSGMIPRGEVALIIAGMGLSMGYLDSKVFGIGIMMTLVTTLAAPPALVALFNVKRPGARDDLASTKDSRPVSFKLGSDNAARVMIDRLIAAFRNEGFFTSLLNPEEDIWHVSRDTAEITTRRRGDTIEFECTPEEEAFIGTAIVEICTELNSLAQEFAKPLKSGEIASFMKEGQKARLSGDSDVLHCIRRFIAIPRIDASSVDDLVEKMIAEIVKTNPAAITDAAKAKEAVMTRENAMSTGLDRGLAVPHGRTDAVKDLVGAVAIVGNEHGIPGYPTIDNGPVRIVVLTIAPSQGSAPHLRVMSYLSRKLRENDGIARLSSCKTSSEMMKFLLY